jgi:hypothetical protein
MEMRMRTNLSYWLAMSVFLLLSFVHNISGQIVTNAIEDFETGDFTKFPWYPFAYNTNPDAEWIVAPDNPASGNFCAKAVNNNPGGNTYLSVTLDCEDGEISFWRKLSSSYNRGLSFCIDDRSNRIDSWGGEKDWEKFSYPVTAGIHTLIWFYKQDQEASPGEAAWIDDIVFPAIHYAEPPIYVSNEPASVIPNGFGTNIHFTGDQQDLDLIAQGGLKFIRMDLFWNLVETMRSFYNFTGTGYDALTEGCANRDMRILYILDYSNSLYESARSVRTEQGRRAFAAYAETAAKRYAGKGILWEIWNEPTGSTFWNPQPSVEDYCKLVEVTAPRVKQADPTGLVLGPASAGIPFDWLEECFGKGLLEWIDALTVHPYRSRRPETVINDYNSLRTLIARYAPEGKNIPIISGEWGYSLVTWGNSPRLTQLEQAEYLVRMFLVNLYQGIPLSIWYDWRDDGTNPSEREHNFGIVANNLAHKDAYLAAKNLTSTLSGYSFEKRLPGQTSNDFILEFKRGGSRAIAFWTIYETHTMTLPLRAGKGRLISLMGSQVDVNWDRDGLMVGISESPQYLLIDDNLFKASHPIPENGSSVDSTRSNVSWSPSPHAVLHDVYFGEDFNDVNEGSVDTFKGTQSYSGFSVAKDLVPGTIYYWRVDEVNDSHPDSPWEGDVWSFQFFPGGACDPNPPDGGAVSGNSPILHWNLLGSGYLPAYDVYYGTDFDEVSSGTVATASTSTPMFRPDMLVPGTKYYWRVDTQRSLGRSGAAPYKGEVWCFVFLGYDIADHEILDDFEQYNDHTNKIIRTWIDGSGYVEPLYGNPANYTGSTVGHLSPPFVEIHGVHGGRQAMVLNYNNVDIPFYSETERFWIIPQSWNPANFDTLKLSFCGNADNMMEPLYIALEDSSGRVSSVHHPNLNAVQLDRWLDWEVQLAEFAGAGFDLSNIKKMYIGVGDRDSPERGGTGTLYIDDIYLYKY